MLKGALRAKFSLLPLVSFPLEEVSYADLGMDDVHPQRLVNIRCFLTVFDALGDIVDYAFELVDLLFLHQSSDLVREFFNLVFNLGISSWPLYIVFSNIDLLLKFTVLVHVAVINKGLQLLPRKHETHAYHVAHDSDFSIDFI